MFSEIKETKVLDSSSFKFTSNNHLEKGLIEQSVVDIISYEEIFQGKIRKIDFSPDFINLC